MIREKQKEEIDMHLKLLEQQKQEELIQDAHINNTMNQQLQNFGASEQEQEQQKREYLRSVMEDNKRLMQYRNQAKQREKEMELELEKNTTRLDFFDRHRSFR